MNHLLFRVKKKKPNSYEDAPKRKNLIFPLLLHCLSLPASWLAKADKTLQRHNLFIFNITPFEILTAFENKRLFDLFFRLA